MPETYTTVARDPFARCELVRYPHAGDIGCDWCGNRPRVLFSYEVWDDAKPRPEDRCERVFCNLECYRIYYD